MILRPTASIEDWREFLAKPDLHWKPGRSAMETAHAWEQAQGLPPEIAELFPEGTELLLAIPEYKVPLPGGARDSQNDVFALLAEGNSLIACMVEAKRDEPFGPTLADWQGGGGAGKNQRLAALTEILCLDPAVLVPDIRYQLVHRAASAVLTARRFRTRRAAMVVQSFSSEHRWFEDYSRFVALFGMPAERNRIVTAQLHDEMELSFGWASAPIRTEAITT